MINILDRTFATLLSQLLENCQDQKIIMIPYEKLRSPQIQAHFWAQGRTFNEIKTEIKKLKNEKAFFLARCIENAKIKEGKIITNALPGCSWHQWGEAADCYWLKNYKISWDIKVKDENNQNGYEVYASEARKLGLEAGFYWENLIDATHVQLQSSSSPLNYYSLAEIDKVMEDFYR